MIHTLLLYISIAKNMRQLDETTLSDLETYQLDTYKKDIKNFFSSANFKLLLAL